MTEATEAARIYPLDRIGYVAIVNKHDNPVLSIANAARVSYNTKKDETDEKDKRLVEFLWNHQHSSPFRHQLYTIEIKLPLFVARQWQKHQIGSSWLTTTINDEEVCIDFASIQFDIDNGCTWNEVSGRYVKLAPEFYIPARFRSNAGHANKQASSEDQEWTDEDHGKFRVHFQKSVSKAYQKYQEAIDMGMAREMARMLLPQNVYTSAIWTTSLQSLLHFFSLRLKEDAQWEIRQYAEAIESLLHDDLAELGIHYK